MITIKNKAAIAKMEEAGRFLSQIFSLAPAIVRPGMSTLDIDVWMEEKQREYGLTSKMKGYKGYKHVSCISVNDVVVHGIPSKMVILQQGDLIKVDVCVAWKEYCADMARAFFVGQGTEQQEKFVAVAYEALDAGIAQAYAGNHLSDISAAIQNKVEKAGFGVVRDFAGHGIGKRMHEEPEILNFGKPGKGPVLRAGMALALEPMITMGSHKIKIMSDGWTAKTADGSLAAHVEDTIVITDTEPKIITRIV